ncbi:hypothetical protein RB653_001502 [Dictyostelium firmibasis]|uniref:Uncharacterized protein n=1 Tax=Dictyostelium firmibasis TaxID=79012 RepID=A0AAN7TX23_9MYCE
MSDQEYYKDFSNKIIKERKKNLENDESKVLYFTLAGSHSFNLNVETSDRDYFGVYCSDIDDILVGDIKQPIIDSHEPDDYILFEVERFCELLYKGNPKLIEPMFTSRFCYRSPIWEQLILNRKELISQSVIQHYLSYSKSQMGDASKLIFKKNGSTSTTTTQEEEEEDKKKLLLSMINSNHSYSKKLYHTYRLLLDTRRMLELGEPIVYLQGEEREKIMKIRMGEEDLTKTLTEIQQLFNQCYQQFQEVKEKNLIQENLNIKVLNNWLIQVRKQSYLQKEASSGISTVKYTDADFEINDIKSYNLLKVYNHFQSLLTKHKLENARILMIKRSGSVSHNLKHENEDSTDENGIEKKEDWIGVYVAPTESIFSLYPPPRRIDSATLLCTSSKIEEPEDNTNQRDTYLSGIQLFELGYFIQLLSSGNHRVVECFYDKNSASDVVETNIWKDIKKLETDSNFLSVNLIHHCWGVSKGLVERLQRSPSFSPSTPLSPNTTNVIPLSEKRKSLYHAQRLINRAEEILDKKNFTVYLDEDDDLTERNLLLRIKNSSDFTSEQLVQLTTNCLNQVKSVNEKIQKLSNISSADKKLNELSIKQSLKTILIKIRKSMIKIIV